MLYLQCLEQRLAKDAFVPLQDLLNDCYPREKRCDGHSGSAADTDLGLERTLKLVCFLKSQLSILSSLAVLSVCTNSAP